jgi:dynein heavy chain
LDIGRLPRVALLLVQIQENLQNILKNLWHYLKKYRQFKNLWLYNKEKSAESFASKNPSVQAYDEKMYFYTSIINRIADVPKFRVEGCIRLDVRPLQKEICRHARDWVVNLGAFLASSTHELYHALQQTVAVSHQEDILKVVI